VRGNVFYWDAVRVGDWIVKYYCSHCDSVLERNSKKVWMNSFCSDTGKTVRIYRRTRHANRQRKPAGGVAAGVGRKESH
jgi:hypothetical protein